MGIKTKGECPNPGCDAKFRMNIPEDLSDTYQQIMKKALDMYRIELYCQKCEEMVEPNMTVEVD